ncbi:uncharacterized protein UDID_19626 [Ustilago sp. UG-2017a]|nr:uncharacterized protein UDID_19626 [Ustilago sp. UG-2017a]
MPSRVDSVALLEHTMQMIREAHADWDEDKVLERAFSVMNLQPNTNQAEKIPRLVLSIVSQIIKLNENNWAIWEPMFMDCIHPIKWVISQSTAPTGRGRPQHSRSRDLGAPSSSAMPTVATKTVHGSLTLELHITCLSKNLLSIQALTEDGARVIFEESGATILQHDGSMIKSKTNWCKKRWEVYGDSLAARCHGPECSRSRRVTGAYGRSTGIRELVNTSREHGRSAVSMETMDSYGFTCKGGPGPYARRARHSHEEDQAQGACRWLPLRGSRDKSQRNHHWLKEKEQCIRDRQAGPEEEEQCRRS